MYQYFSVYKPFGMLSQFTREANHPSLADLNFKFESDIYPVGRLDTDSEGLLLLTNDTRVNNRLLSPINAHRRTYFAQVEGEIDPESLKKMMKGLELSHNGKPYTTRDCDAERITEPPLLPERLPPVRFRKEIPTSWISLMLTEGKNRQVRKMTAAVGFPTLRLIRISIEELEIDWIPGTVTEWDKHTFYKKLHLKF